jgi:hypothetical protein
MTSLEQLQKALEKFKDCLLDQDASNALLDEFDHLKELFSAFQKDNVVVPRKRLEDVCKTCLVPCDYSNVPFQCKAKQLLESSKVPEKKVLNEGGGA